ncbi:hypothetical protein SNEBB_003599 [Seison nebaliae]|nr:hypothetical protein SNEBB_003599 [Seison nebaliae]
MSDRRCISEHPELISEYISAIPQTNINDELSFNENHSVKVSYIKGKAESVNSKRSSSTGKPKIRGPRKTLRSLTSDTLPIRKTLTSDSKNMENYIDYDSIIGKFNEHQKLLEKNFAPSIVTVNMKKSFYTFTKILKILIIMGIMGALRSNITSVLTIDDSSEMQKAIFLVMAGFFTRHWILPLFGKLFLLIFGDFDNTDGNDDDIENEYHQQTTDHPLFTSHDPSSSAKLTVSKINEKNVGLLFGGGFHFYINGTSEDMMTQEISGWMLRYNSLNCYDAASFTLSRDTEPIYVYCSGGYFVVNYPHEKEECPSRKTIRDEKIIKNVRFVEREVFSMENCIEFCLLPRMLPRKAWWKRRFPILLTFSKRVQLTEMGNEENVNNSGNHVSTTTRWSPIRATGEDETLKHLILFSRNNRQKEDWYAYFVRYFHQTRNYPTMDFEQLSNFFREYVRERHKYPFKETSNVHLNEEVKQKVNSKQLVMNKRNFPSSFPTIPKDVREVESAGILNEVMDRIRLSISAENKSMNARSVGSRSSGSRNSIKSSGNRRSLKSDKKPLKDKIRKVINDLPLEINRLRTNRTTCILTESIWINIILARFYGDMIQHDPIKHWIFRQVKKKVDKINVPDFMEKLKITQLEIGTQLPVITSLIPPWRNNRGVWFGFHVGYPGGAIMSVKTGIKMANKGGQPTNVRPPSRIIGKNTTDYSDDEENDEDDLLPVRPKEIPSAVKPEGILLKLTKSFMNTSIGKSISNMVRTVELTVELQSLYGDILLNLPPIPSDRIWGCFMNMPKIELKIIPKLRSTDVTNDYLCSIIRTKLMFEVRDTFVFPNMVDVTVPYLFHEIQEGVALRPYYFLPTAIEKIKFPSHRDQSHHYNAEVQSDFIDKTLLGALIRDEKLIDNLVQVMREEKQALNQSDNKNGFSAPSRPVPQKVYHKEGTKELRITKMEENLLRMMEGKSKMVEKETVQRKRGTFTRL